MGVLDTILGGAIGAYGQITTNQRNINFQRETNAQNEALMRESWARDDNAVQRRAEDLEAAGMNPLLAAGGAAQSGSPIKLDAPEYGNVAEGAIKGAQAQKQIEMTEAQQKLVEAQADSARADARMKNVDADVKSELASGETTVVGEDGMLEWKREGNYYLESEKARLKKLAAEGNVGEMEQFYKAIHAKDIAQLKKDLLKQGLAGAKLENEMDSLIKRRMERDAKWYGWDKVLGAIGGVAGTVGGLGKAGHGVVNAVRNAITW